MTIISLAKGQTVPLCARQLSPCIDFMNSTKPPDTCCNPAKDVYASHKTCFCQLALTPGILEGLGTTTDQAVQLLHLCGLNFTVTSCKASSSAPPPSWVQPPAMPGADEGGAGKATFNGLSFALFLCACVLFNLEGGPYL
uniref:Bifunctional inhibitor/plant lipid transfer protein/seed storage helical domain-containing protein n=2 Tax=Cajanus cajan TaxID=3821 RepID=A0A151TJG7_CAJCA|nr:hypothetical protein KK1_013523 [Cajanus cajan]